MKRSQVVFVTVVFAALLTGLLVHRVTREDPFEQLALLPPRTVPLAPLAAPAGAERLEGVVLAAQGERSDVADVLVRLRPTAASDDARPLAWTLTDGEGRFVLEELFPGTYEAVLIQRGREHAVVPVEVPAAEEVRWVLGAPLEPVPELPEMVRVPLAGRVVLAGGEAEREGGLDLDGYELLLRPVPGTPELSGAMARRARLDSAGRFRLPDLVCATYRAELLPPWARGGSWPVLAAAEHAHRPPGPGEDGESVERSLELAFAPATLAGRLLDRAGRPVEGALVRIGRPDDEARVWPSYASDATGTFRATGLPDGAFVVRVRAGAAVGQERVELAAGELLELPALVLDPGAAADEGG